MKLSVGNKKGHTIPKELIGLFFEDINFAADGGLYAEMIENRSFEAREAFGTPGNFYLVDDYGYGWSSYGYSSDVKLQFVSGSPLSSANPHYMRVTTSSKNLGFKNKAYDGISLKKGMTYYVTFYARTVKFDGAHFNVFVEKNSKVYASSQVKVLKAAPYMPFCDIRKMDLSEDTPWNNLIKNAMSYDDKEYSLESTWNKYSVELVATDDIEGADFVITFDAPGVVEFDFISMFPEDAVLGIFRKDLFDALSNIKPGFIRFPGGCIVEGISLDNRYYWKNTVGDTKDRPYTPNLWAFDEDRFAEGFEHQRPDSHYGQSFGLGFYEYFLLCEQLGCLALPVLNVGVACQFRSTDKVSIDSTMFEEYVQDALDLIEFANGPVDSKWGMLRAKMGHPDSFNLKLLGVGNEQWETKHLDFFERYKRFEAAIHEKYPEIEIIGSAGPGVDMDLAADAWEYYRENTKDNSKFCYAVDEHYYVAPQWLYDHVNFYDDYDRNVAVFAGEYAAHPESRNNTLEGALAEAALLCGIEKNCDVVKLASYAPLFNRIGHSQWKPDMIWFDSTSVILTPSYYVQLLFSNNLGDYTLLMDGQEKEFQKDNIYISLSKKESGEIILKAVNANPTEYSLEIEFADELKCNTVNCVSLVKAGEEDKALPQNVSLQSSEEAFSDKVVLAPLTVSIYTFH